MRMLTLAYTYTHSQARRLKLYTRMSIAKYIYTSPPVRSNRFQYRPCIALCVHSHMKLRTKVYIDRVYILYVLYIGCSYYTILYPLKYDISIPIHVQYVYVIKNISLMYLYNMCTTHTYVSYIYNRNTH